MEKKCICCGYKVVGRTDKKFCSNGCRYTYHNQLNHLHNNAVRRTQYAARKNKVILETILQRGKKTTTRNDLEQLGFNFLALTGYQQGEPGNARLHVFEMALEERKGVYRILKDRGGESQGL
ncbi:MAG TPA: hypothetical protein VFW78_07070 [Bacteroidia bacterium]|nr:hypothetical protein [Bacteroidia bacterium]